MVLFYQTITKMANTLICEGTQMSLYNRIFYVCILLLCAAFIFFGNRIASSGDLLGFTDHDDGGLAFHPATITRIVDVVDDDNFGFITTSVTFEARLTERARRGEEVVAVQLLSDFFTIQERPVEMGDRVMLAFDDFDNEYFFTDYLRVNAVAVLGVAFLVLVVIFGRAKGFNAIIALMFTCLAVFLVFIPAILAGRNIYAATLIVCLFSIVSTLLIVIGPNKKALSAMLGCLGGVMLASILMLVMDSVLHLSGMADHDSQTLFMMSAQSPIDLRAIVFAGIILGAVGAIMDVAMTISSSLWEVQEVGAVTEFRPLFKSGINIGRDVLGTMLNTLILAYIGSSLSLILVLVVLSPSYLQLFNMELLSVEFVRALIGAFGMFATIPLTALICGLLYSVQRKNEPTKSLRGSKRLDSHIDN